MRFQSFFTLLAVLFLSFQASAQSSHANEQILFLGSSTMEFWQPRLKTDFPNLNIVDLGKAGTEFSYLLQNAEQWMQQYPDTRVVIYSGDNDIASGKSPEVVFRDAEELVWMIHERLSSSHLYLISVKACPARIEFMTKIRRLNSLMKNLARAIPNVTYVDGFSALLDANGRPAAENFRSDGLHLTAIGYAKWARLLTPLLVDDAVDTGFIDHFFW